MSKQNRIKKDQASATQTSSEKFIEYVKLIVSTLLAVFLIRAFIISTYQIPTGSMEDTLLTGDHIIANKFVFAIHTPDWIGIPYTRIGFNTPFIQLPGIRKPKKGDIVIFKYPEDTRDSYVKRCIAVSGDTLEIRDKKVYINSVYHPNAPDGKFIINQIYPKEAIQPEIFPPGAGNKDNFGPIRIPVPGDTFQFDDSNKELWYERFVIMAYEGQRIEFIRSNNIMRFKPSPDFQDKRRWMGLIRQYPAQSFRLNGKSLDKTIYRVKYLQYFMMGDNRDNSLDSRYWGFVPYRYVLGEPVIIYWSWNKGLPIEKIVKKVRWNRFLRLIR